MCGWRYRDSSIKSRRARLGSNPHAHTVNVGCLIANRARLIKCTCTHCQCGVSSNRSRLIKSSNRSRLIKSTCTLSMWRLIKSGASDQSEGASDQSEVSLPKASTSALSLPKARTWMSALSLQKSSSRRGCTRPHVRLHCSCPHCRFQKRSHPPS